MADSLTPSDISSAAAPAADTEPVVVQLGAGVRTEITAGDHRLTSDEPAALGGTGGGPTPYDLVAAGLGSCTAVTLRLYADRKDWPLEGVTVHMTHGRVHVADCLSCEDENVGMFQITRTIDLRGPLTDEQRARLFQIADRCPVHRTLAQGIRIVTRSAAADK
jgi:putative redox protein